MGEGGGWGGMEKKREGRRKEPPAECSRQERKAEDSDRQARAVNNSITAPCLLLAMRQSSHNHKHASVTLATDRAARNGKLTRL